ncbi:MAG: hypothetical protein V4668_04585 [Patescibacteria group bacterium]
MIINQAVGMRIISAGIPLIFILLGAVFFPTSTQYWVFVLTMTMCVGYIHFFIGTVYQVEGIAKKPHRNVNTFLFISISLLAFAVCRLFINVGWEVLLGAFTIVYFIIHVLLNEKTFLQAQLGIEIGYFHILSFAVLIVPPFLLALVHPSFFYDFSLQYPAIDSAQYRQIIEAFISMDFLFYASLWAIGIFLIVLPYQLLKQYGHWPAILSGVCGLMVFFAIFIGAPFHFVYLLHFVLMYHFILLFFIFLQYFATKKPAALSRYNTLHVVAFITIVSIALIPFWQSRDQFLYTVYAVIFNFGNFLTISIMHVSVSFLNEPWFVKLFKR